MVAETATENKSIRELALNAMMEEEAHRRRYEQDQREQHIQRLRRKCAKFFNDLGIDFAPEDPDDFILDGFRFDFIEGNTSEYSRGPYCDSIRAISHSCPVCGEARYSHWISSLAELGRFFAKPEFPLHTCHSEIVPEVAPAPNNAFVAESLLREGDATAAIAHALLAIRDVLEAGR